MIKYKSLIVRENKQKEFTHSIEEKETGTLEKGKVLIKVKYSSLNYKDGLSLKGNKGITQQYPHTPGIDASGIIKEAKTPLLQPGEEVIVTSYDLGMNTAGGFAEYIIVPYYWVVKCPDNLSLKEAMIYGTAGFTAALCIEKCMLNGLDKEKEGEVLVTGATGGVGSVAVAILSKLGYNVTALSRKKDKSAFLKKLGAKDIIQKEDIISKRPLEKPRWSAVIDCVGGEILAGAIKACKNEASVATCGMVSSTDLNTSIFPFILRGVNLLGVDSQSFPIDKRKAIWNKLSLDWKIDLNTLCREISLDEVASELELILKGKQTGRVLVKL